MRLLVTGAAGFIGKHVVDAAVRRRWEVVAVVRRGGGQELDPACRVVVADLSGAYDLLAKALPAEVDAVVHLAGRVARGTGPAACAEAIAGAAGTTLPLLAALAGRVTGRIVVATSAAKYGRAARAGPVGEDATPDPVDAYGLARAHVAGLLAFLARREGMPLVEAVPFNVVGAGQGANLVPAAFARRIAALPPGGGRIDVGPTAAVRDFVDAADVAEAFLLLAERGEVGRAYNVATGRGVAIGELLKRMQGLSSVAFDWAEVEAHKTAWDVPSVVADVSAIGALGFTPRVTLDESLARTLRDAGV